MDRWIVESSVCGVHGMDKMSFSRIGSEHGAARLSPAFAMSASDGITVRRAQPTDMPLVHEMIHELAAYEGFPDGPKLTVEDLVEDGFNNKHPWFFVLLAEKDGEVVGSALCNRAYSSWSRRAFYIEDLFVRPVARRQGVGLRLIKELSKMAVAEGVHRMDWHVLKNNETALAFYNRLGARDLRVTEGRAALRLDRDRIEALAKDD